MHHTWPYIIGWFLRNILRALRCPFSSFNSHMAILSESAFSKSLNIVPSPLTTCRLVGMFIGFRSDYPTQIVRD